MKALVALIDAVAWPAVVAWALWFFRHPITRLLERLRSAGIAGASIELAAEQQQAGAADITRALEPPPGILDEHPVYAEVDRVIIERLRQQGDTAEQQLPHAIRLATTAWFSHYSELVYRLIFGSQLALLRILSVNEQDVSYAQASYQQLRTSYPDFYGVYTYDQWIGFLKNAAVIVEDNNRLRITPRGREFLEYLRVNGLPENKHY